MSDPSASTLVFHDWAGNLDLEKWRDAAMTFFKLINAAPNAVSYRLGNAKRGKVRVAYLPKVIAKRDVKSIEIHELLPPFDDYEKCSAYAAFTVSDRAKTAVFSNTSEAINIDVFLTIIQEFAKCAQVTYGYAFLRNLRRGPVFYAYDISYGLDMHSELDRAEQAEMSFWLSERLDMVLQKKRAPFRHLRGLLRDVFTLSVLTAPHIENKIAGQPLSEWISRDPSHGSLQLVADGVWVWLIPQQHLPHIREILQSAGLLIAKPPLPTDVHKSAVPA